MLSGIGPRRPSAGRRRAGERSTCRASAATCRTTWTSTRSPNARATISYDNCGQAPPDRAWPGLQYLLTGKGAGRLHPVRDRRLLVRGRRPEHPRHPGSTSASARASRRASNRLGNAGVTLNSAYLRPRSAARQGAPRLGRSAGTSADRSQLLGRPRTTGRCRSRAFAMAREILQQAALAAVHPRRAPTGADGGQRSDQLTSPMPIAPARPTTTPPAPAGWATTPTRSSVPT